MNDPEGTIETASPDIMRPDLVHVRGVDRYGPAVKRGAFIPVSAELLRDSAIDVMPLIERDIDRLLRPWNYPDRYAFPRIDLFPRWQRLVDTYRDWRLNRRPIEWDD